ncbi:hypothetical protein ACIPY6_21215 [Streptomyces sp. NPDC090054]|uniref:hypothetical protein n=1 Tax=Streptomyces sp. NPDC090054 TaxID=3365933 RepID=UPI003828456E
MEEQGGAGGVPPHDGHHSQRPPRRARPDDGRTPAADTDEASRLDRPHPTQDAGSGRKRWVGPTKGKDDGSGTRAQ